MLTAARARFYWPIDTCKTTITPDDGDEEGKNEAKLTGMRSAYFCRIRSASALRFSKGCSSLNLDRMMIKYVLDCFFDLICIGEDGY